jgi:periplasmic divalent cation tolerance protein
MSGVAIVTTVATRDEARRLAHALVERHLAACAQIEAIESVYAWQGAIEQAAELRLVFKTTAACQAAAMRAIAELHPYDVPEIHAQALGDVHPPYAAWMADWVDASAIAAGGPPVPPPEGPRGE